MGSSYTTSGATSEPMWAILSDYSQYLPGLLDELGQAETPAAIASLKAANQTVNPGSNQVLGSNALNLQQLQKYALPEAQVGQKVAESNALAGANTNLKQITGAGGQAAGAATQLMNDMSPAYRKANEEVNSINLNGLSPGEANAVERANNQNNSSTGNLGLINPTNTISNAINFGGAYNNKLGVLNNAIGTATNAAQGFSPINVALGQPNSSTGSNFGTGQFTNTNSNSANASNSNVFNFGSGLLGNLTSSMNTSVNAGASMANATSPAAYLGSVCCFIFLEAYNGKIPKCVRRGRDKYYYKNHFMAAGYRRMASWLVPLMQENSLIRAAVWHGMVKPITEHLHSPKKGWRKNLTHFWLRAWAVLGKNKCEADYCTLMEYQRV